MSDRSERLSTPKTQVLPQTTARPPAQAAAVIGLAVVVAIIIGALYLAQATVTATTGSNLIQLQRTRDFLQRANSDSEAQIALKSSISTLRGRALELGFRPAEPADLVYLIVEGYTPNRATPTPMITPTPARLYDETFAGWLEQQWASLVMQFEAWMGRGK
ncbi:MAG TPA: hypothetical protein PLD47_17355 [Aggregatilineales bacterium]|nr:hypothetical protein [Anaerolineales bacterium]HRE49496.1 hypothetical protein [Aggregatilineales bacterium]